MKPEAPPPLMPSDRLGRMLVVSMLLHLAVVGVVLLVHPKSSKVGLTPSYTVDLVDFPGLPGVVPGPQTASPGPPAGAPAAPTREEPAPTPPPKGKPDGTAAIPKPQTPVRTPPRAAPRAPMARVQPRATPSAVPPKPAPPMAKPVARAVPEPGLSPKKAARAAKPAPTPLPTPPAPDRTPARQRDTEIAQALQASQAKARRTDRDQDIAEAVQGVEKGVATRNRNQAYKEAVGESAARLAAGKVSARLAGKSARGGGGGGAAGGGGAGGLMAAGYGQKVARIIRGNWQPNCLQRSNLKALKAVIVVRVANDGTISASWFEHESGDRLYDQAAMAAVTRANPLPPLPPGQEQLEIGITFTPEWKASS